MQKTSSSIIEKTEIFYETQEFLADLETPVSAFLKVCNKKAYAFLLESVENNEKIGRYSILGCEPVIVFENRNNKTSFKNIETNSSQELNDNPFEALNTILKNTTHKKSKISDFIGFIGYFGFENIRWIEPRTGYKNFNKGADVCLTLPGKLVIFDHIERKVSLIAISTKNDCDLKNKLKDISNQLHTESIKPQHLELNFDDSRLADFEGNFTKDEYMKMVEKAKEYIHKGDIFQIVPSQKMKIKGSYDGFTLYRALRSINPSPYLFYLNFNDFELAGSSPEVMVKCEDKDENKIASVRPIAGTYPRGKNELEDEENVKGLSNDPKEIAEHLMLVDLARNDLGRVCEIGSINVPELMVIEKYSHVFHMVSLVQGILKENKTSIDLLAACFPHGTLSGAPKIRAMEIINELEKEQRGPYGGCLGFIGINDTINTCMTIRTFVIREDHLEIQAGGGVVADSDPENEYMETIRKGSALLKAISLIS